MELEYVPVANYEKKVHGRYVCPYNEECRCTVKVCYKCGWHPKVAKARLAKIKQARKEAMA